MDIFRRLVQRTHLYRFLRLTVRYGRVVVWFANSACGAISPARSKSLWEDELSPTKISSGSYASGEYIIQKIKRESWLGGEDTQHFRSGGDLDDRGRGYGYRGGQMLAKDHGREQRSLVCA